MASGVGGSVRGRSGEAAVAGTITIVIRVAVVVAILVASVVVVVELIDGARMHIHLHHLILIRVRQRHALRVLSASEDPVLLVDPHLMKPSRVIKGHPVNSDSRIHVCNKRPPSGALRGTQLA